MSEKTLKDYEPMPLGPPREVSGDGGMSQRRVAQRENIDGQFSTGNSMDSGEKPRDGSSHPFKIKDSSGGGWETFSNLSTITDEEDMSNLFISGLTTTGRTSTGQVYVDVTLTDGSFDSAAIVVGLFTAETIIVDGVQTKAQLLLGSVSVDGSTYTFRQAVTESRILTYGFENGIRVRVFAAHPTHVGNV